MRASVAVWCWSATRLPCVTVLRFFLHRTTRSPWMAIHSKGWWKKVVLQEFNEDEWRENFCLTLTSFDKLRVWAGVVPSERWHFCTNWLDVRGTRWSRVSLMYERPPWGLVPANRGAFSSGSWSFSCIERIRVQVLSRVDGYKEPQRVRGWRYVLVSLNNQATCVCGFV